MEEEMTITRAAIYARYSSDEQIGGESIDYQLDCILLNLSTQT
jgi:hypothetical protein